MLVNHQQLQKIVSRWKLVFWLGVVVIVAEALLASTCDVDFAVLPAGNLARLSALMQNASVGQSEMAYSVQFLGWIQSCQWIWVVAVAVGGFTLFWIALGLQRSRDKIVRDEMEMFGEMKGASPQIVVLTNLFPHAGTPGAGTFIRERMFRVAQSFPMAVIVPVPWFPFQRLIGRFRPHFRPPSPRMEINQGIPVFLPRFFSVPRFFRCCDGLTMAIASYGLIRRLKKHNPRTIIDAHFAYPAGFAAVLLGRWLDLPVTITMRGTEVSLASFPCRRERMLTAINRASRVFSVSDSLRRHAGALGANLSGIRVVGNGVDLARFYPEDPHLARARFGLPLDSLVLVSVGGLVERKGFHRVIEVLPKLIKKYGDLHYLVVGGGSPEGDIVEKLRQQVVDLDLENVVHFVGALPSDEIRWPLSAAHVFVLSTRNEGWANVFLEAMACGLPVVTTDVGGNKEVVSRSDLGTIIEFGNEKALFNALDDALSRVWPRTAIIEYAKANTWDSRVAVLVEEFRSLSNRHFDHDIALRKQHKHG